MSDSSFVRPHWLPDKFLFGVKLNSPSDISTLSPDFSIVKISGHSDPDAISQIRQRNNNVVIIADLFDSLIREGYVDVSQSYWREQLHRDLREYYEQGIRYFELWGTPNLPQYGLGQRQGWEDGVGFGNWYKELVSSFKSEFPEISIGYPALNIYNPPVSTLEWDKFLSDSGSAVEATDWIEVAWVVPGDPKLFAQLTNRYRLLFPTKLLFINVSLGNTIPQYSLPDLVQDFSNLIQVLNSESRLGAVIANASSAYFIGLSELASKLNTDNDSHLSPLLKGSDEAQTPQVTEPQPESEEPTELVTHHSVANDQLPVVDQLHYDDYARALAEVLVSEETTTPLTVGIYGAWGMGKSFLMRRVKEMVAQWPMNARDFRPNAQKPKHDFLFIEFNAWVYSGSENLWAGLITGLYDGVEKYIGNTRAFWHRFIKNTRKSLKKTLWAVLPVFIVGILLALLLNYSELATQWENLSKIVNTIFVGGAVLAAIPTLYNAGREFFSTFIFTRSEQLANFAARPNFKDKIGFMSDIKDQIGEINELLNLGKTRGRSIRAVILIDDLDRCPPAKAVEVLEAIMLLLADKDGAPFIVLLGIDARIIVKAIEERYNKVLIEAGITGYEYLDKIVQIPFRIPEPDEASRKAYVSSLLTPPDWPYPLNLSQEVKNTAFVPPFPPNLFPPAPETPKAAEPKDPGQTKPAQPIPGTPDNPLPIKKSIEVSATKGEVAAFGDFSKYLSPNPRRMKRIVNVYRVARLLPRALTETQRRKLIKWVILSEQWPLRLSWILEEIENDQQQFPEAPLASQETANNDQPPAGRRYNEACTLGEVFEKIQERFDKAGRAATLDGDPELFEQFIKQEPLISVADNKWLWPLSFNLNPAIKQEIWKARSGK